MNNSAAENPKFRYGDWLTAILLLIILQIAAARLVATLWTKDLRLVQVVTLLGTLLGLALGKSIFKRLWVIFLATAYGLAIIPWQLGLTLDPEIEWRQRLVNLWGRLGFVISELLTRKPITDNLLFLFLMALLFWTLSVYAAYTLLRDGNPWKVIIPGGITAFVIHSFDPLLVSRSWYLAFYLFFALMLVARMVFLRNAARWRERHTHTPPDIGFDFSRVTIVLTMVLVFFAWNVPVLADSFKPAAEIWQSASRPWLSAKDRFGFMFASLKASVGLVNNLYGDTLALGLGPSLSDQVVMEVEAPTDPPNGYRFYWEARTYTTYGANFWQSSPRDSHELTPDSVDINQPGAAVRPVVSTTFFPHAAISNLYTAPEPVWFSLSTRANMDIQPDGSVNYAASMSKNIVRPGEQYSIRSAIDALTVVELQAAGTAYPQWVRDEYLQVPDNISLRTRELATQIASDLTNPYDITNAVTLYLRDNITYTQIINSPPANQERLDWFLFDYKQGFCNYYASAEVILLRLLGIPTRMAVGFAQGERQTAPIQEQATPEPGGEGLGPVSETSTYIVRQKDAHAWPEVFFPGIGWVIFEPTVSQPVLFRPTGEPATNTEQNLADANQPDGTGPQDRNIDLPRPGENDGSSNSSATSLWSLGNIVKLVGLVLAVTLLAVVVWQVRRGFKVRPFLEKVSIDIPERMVLGFQRIGIRPPEFLLRWVYFHRLPVLSRSYMEINRALVRVGKKPAIQDTPAERTDSLIKVIPSATAPASQLLAEYQTSAYSPYPADLEVAQQAGRAIRKLSWIALLSRILSRFQEPTRTQRL